MLSSPGDRRRRRQQQQPPRRPPAAAGPGRAGRRGGGAAAPRRHLGGGSSRAGGVSVRAAASLSFFAGFGFFFFIIFFLNPHVTGTLGRSLQGRRSVSCPLAGEELGHPRSRSAGTHPGQPQALKDPSEDGSSGKGRRALSAAATVRQQSIKGRRVADTKPGQRLRGGDRWGSLWAPAQSWGAVLVSIGIE